MEGHRYEVLRGVDNNIYADKEPQMVQLRATNQAVIYLDSEKSANQQNKTKMILSSKQNNTDIPHILYQNVQRLKFYSGGINWVTPNVNIRNNEIIFYSDVSLELYTVTIPEGFYDTQVKLMDALIVALNSVTGVSGLTFGYIQKPLFPKTFILSAVGGNFYFDLSCAMIKKGVHLINLPKSQTLTNEKIVGPINLYYTRYVDLISSQLNQYSKVISRGNDGNSNIVFRYFTSGRAPENSGVPQLLVREGQQILSVFNTLKDKSIRQIDFELVDEFGEELYVPDDNEGTNTGFWWDVQIILEL
jgi:hypothetical protein